MANNLHNLVHLWGITNNLISFSRAEKKRKILNGVKSRGLRKEENMRYTLNLVF